MKKSVLTLFLIGFIMLVYTACQKETQVTDSKIIGITPELFSVDYNAGSKMSLGARFLDNKKASVGRVLFYDKQLSANNSTACATCHVQAFAFSDGGQTSMGFIGEMGTRNAMPLFNLPDDGFYFWDMRAENLSAMILDPALHKGEMGLGSTDEVLKKVSEAGYYNELFQEAYGNRVLDVNMIRECLAEFVSSIHSISSQSDLQNNTLSTEAVKGRMVFMDKGCIQCHGEINFNNQVMANGTVRFKNFVPSQNGSLYRDQPIRRDSNASLNFVAVDFANIGLDYTYNDQGVAPDRLEELNAKIIGEGVFKIPSLRNLAFTAPYMHDGRFKTLDEVLAHYNGKLKAHPVLDERLRATGMSQPVSMQMTEDDMENLKMFLMSLSDYNLITNKKWSDPFVYAKN